MFINIVYLIIICATPPRPGRHTTAWPTRRLRHGLAAPHGRGGQWNGPHLSQPQGGAFQRGGPGRVVSQILTAMKIGGFTVSLWCTLTQNDPFFLEFWRVVSKTVVIHFNRL